MHSSVRIVVLDYYMSSPIPGLDVVYSEFRGTSINQVPILRCFGSTENGKKICVHIHGVFPYLYIPYDGKGKPEELMYQIASALDRAINVSFNQSNSNAQHVYKISLVSGIPMYGFHSRKHQFFKIYLYNPKLVSRAGSMLLNKHILDRVFQPHEIHLNFTLQFMIDYNLHGMSNMLISDMKYRANPSGVNSDIDKTLILPPSIERTSTSELECDTNAEFILNRQEILSGNLAVNPGIAALWEDEKQRRRNKNEDSQLGKFLELKNMNTPPTKTHLIFQQALRERLAILSTDNELPKQDFEASIYPAETPSDSSIQNASLIDIHSTSSLEFSLDDILDLSCSQHNKTLTPSGETLNVTMDDDAQEFLHLLQDLAEEKITEDETEEASILSQVVSADQNDDLVEDLDLSMPLEAFTTPIKLNTTLVNDKSDEEDADYFNTTLIPQLDGQTEYTDSDEEDFIKPTKELLDRLTNSCRKSQLVIKCGKAKYLRSMSVSDVCSLKTEYTTRPSNAASHIKSQLVINSDKPKCRRSMPLLDVCSFKTDYTTRSANSLDKFNLVSPVKLERITSQAYVKVEPLNASKILLRGLDKNKIKRAPEAILEEKIRLICHRINRIASKSKIKRIGKLMLTHEKSMMNSFKKTAMPKFNVLPACKWFLATDSNDDGHCTVVSRLLELTHNYIDPDLHAIIKTPSASYSLKYLGCPSAKTTDLSKDFHFHAATVLYDNSLNTNENRKMVNIKRKKLFGLWDKILNIVKKSSDNNYSIPPGVDCNHNNSVVETEDSFDREDVRNTNESEQEPTRHECLDPKYQADLRKEAEEANHLLQGHLQFLKEFDLNFGIPKSAKAISSNSSTSSFSAIRCLNGATENSEKIIETAKCSKIVEPLIRATSKGDSSATVTILKNRCVPLVSPLFDHDYALKTLSYSKLQSKKDSDSSVKFFRHSSCASYKKITMKHASYDTKHDTSTHKIHFSFSTDVDSKSYSKSQCATCFEGASKQLTCRNNVPLSSSASELKLKLSESLKDQEIEAQIDIRLVNPFKSKYFRGNASSVPFGSGRGASGESKTLENEEISLVKRSTQSINSSKRPRLTIPNIYINCDGTADSSSEDEQKKDLKKGAVRRKLRSSHYAPLGITVTKSPVTSGNFQRGFAENAVQFSGDRKFCQENASQLSRTESARAPISYKRQLTFEHETLNKTSYEEHFSCTYSSKSVPKIKKSNGSHSDSVVTSVTHSNTKLTRTEQPSLEDDSYQNTLYSITVEPNNSETCESTSSSDSDLFSEVSKRYDRENKYTAKEGCSTVFTPTSMPCSKASSKSQESKVLSSSTSSDIPPYQNSSQNKKIKLSGKTLKVETSTDNFCKSYVKPSFKAPTRLRVEETLTEYQIPRVKQQEPFYSCVDDYSGIVEIGHRIMRIASKTTAHLSEFDSEFDGLNSYRKYFIENAARLTWNANNIKHLKMAHCSSNFIIVHPVKKPPSAAQVKQWVKMNSKVRKDTDTTSETKTKQTKIHVPNSPGNDSDLDLSLTLTPITTPQLSISNSSENHSYTYLPNSQYSASQVSEHKKSISELKTMASPKPSIRDSLLSSDETNKSYQITGVTQDNSFGFEKSVQNLQAVRALTVHQYLTTMVMELHIRTRGELKPDPELDNICGIFYSIWNDIPECGQKSSKARGVIAINCLPADLGASRPDFLDGIEINCDITYVETEDALISSFVEVIRYWDPDIFAGYEIEMLSWGYLVDRAHVLSINILPLLGRSELHKYGKVKLKTLMSEVESNIVGRIVLDVWRVMRHEIALQSYTFQSIVYHILHRRIPFYQCNDLTFWWDHRSNLYRHRVVRYYLQRVDTVLELFDKLDFLNRTSELARLFGILFYEVLSRGSQFRVESMMLRLAKPLNYVPVSPDTKQRAKMRAPEYIPLVMEPESKFYTDPVIVLDFQSLYPSIIIAYNYCFTTCVGRVSNLGTNYPFEFGATQLKVPKKIVEKLLKRDLLNISPCGVAFVKQKVREGILPRMLKEVLDTRLMVKNSMKENKGNGNLQKVLHNRQLGLKLIANVTYGYTAANFSGRMCCVEVGDSVVSKGRETLQRAIALVESTPDWQAKVVYGDTDSMFVLTPGKTKEEAFEIGKKIADAVTADNPDPVTLKLEKVYQPCILQTKKRYVGYMYEGPDQKEPVYEAKGIETVRRDGCPAVSKMLQKCLTILFETKNVSLIKSYVLKQFNKIQTGRASIQDLTFAKEYRGNSGYKPGACVPALELARRWKAVDKRSEPRSGERVPYIIVNGPPGLPLIRLVKSPRDLLNDSSLRPNALYYITKVIIPPINRCLNLIGADLNVWFSQMPRKNTQYLPNSSPNIKSTISQYFITRICASCSEPSQEGLCAKCCQNANVAALVLTEKLKRWEENYHNTVLICQSCTGYMNEVVCASLDCPVLYRRTQTFNDLQQSTYVRELLTNSTVFAEDHFFESLY